MQYFVHASADQVGDHDKASGVEHVNEVAEILNPKDPVQASRRAYRYRREGFENPEVAVAVLANPLKGRRHGRGVGLAGAQHIDGAVLQELDGSLHQRHGNRIRRVRSIMCVPNGTGDLAGASAQKRIDTQSVTELISEPIEVRENLEVAGQGNRQDIVAAVALALRERVPELEYCLDVELRKAPVTLTVHPPQERSQVIEVSHGSARSLCKPGEQ